MFYRVYTGPAAFPDPVSRPGNFTSSGTTVTFDTLPIPVLVGDWIYSSTLNQVRRVTQILVSPTVKIDEPFSPDVLVPEPVFVISTTCCACCYTSASITNFGGGNGLFNGELFPDRTVLNVCASSCDGPCVVFTIDASGTKINILA